MKKKKTMAGKILPALIGSAFTVAVFSVIMLCFFSARTKTVVDDYSNEMQEKNRETIFDKILPESEFDQIINVNRQSVSVNQFFLDYEQMLRSIGDSAQKLYEIEVTKSFDKEAFLSLGSKARPYYCFSDEYDENDPETAAIMERMSPIMIALKEGIVLNSDVTSIYFASPLGFMIMADASEQPSEDRYGFNFTDRDWYKQALEQKDAIFFPAYEDYFTGETVITGSLPVYSGDELVGVVAVDISADILDAVIGTDSSYYGRDTFIIDKDANVVYYPKKNIYLDSMIEDGRIPTDRFPAILTLSQNIGEEMLAMVYITLSEDRSSQMEIPPSADFTEDELTALDEGRLLLATYSSIPVAQWVCVSIGEPTVAKAGRESEQEYAQMSENQLAIMNAAMVRGWIIIIGAFVGVCLFMYLMSRRVAKKLSAPVEKLTEKVRSVEGDNLEIEPDPDDDIEETSLLAESFCAMTGRVRQYIEDVTSLTAEKERLSAELDVAKKIQADMLSQDFPDQRELKLYASMTPAKEVGGDFYDFFQIDDDHMGLVIADVSGKGVPAALFMVKAMTLIKNATMIGGMSPAGILEVVNNALCEGNEEMLFVTAWFAVMTISTGDMVCANAGHEFPMIKRKGGSFELLQDEHDIPLAAMPGMTFQEYNEKLDPGDILFVYTDGFPESINEKTEQFTEERILIALNEVPNNDPRDLIEHTREAVKGFVGKADQFDDMTALCIIYQNKEKPDTIE